MFLSWPMTFYLWPAEPSSGDAGLRKDCEGCALPSDTTLAISSLHRTHQRGKKCPCCGAHAERELLAWLLFILKDANLVFLVIFLFFQPCRQSWKELSISMTTVWKADILSFLYNALHSDAF